MEVRPIDANALKRYMGLEEAVKYGNKTDEQRHNSYDTLMKYEIADCIDDMPTIETEQNWISVKDRLPEEETEVLCYLGNAVGKGIVVAFRRRGDWYFDGWTCPTVTHWMPLPQPPKEDAE